MSDANDRLTRFLIDRAGVRGVHVRLDDAWARVRANMRATGERAPAALELLGEALAAAALFTGHTKVDGRLAVQLRTPGALRTLFAECTASGTVRGIVRVDPDAGAVPRNPAEFGEGSVLAITIENPPAPGRRDPVRYQGLVGLQADSLAGAFEDYFRQSEQLPTRLLLATDGDRVAGLMLQKLPGDEGDEDGWNRSSALFDTLPGTELLEVPASLLLTRLFHEDGVQLLGGRDLEFGCSCSTGRVEAMLVSLGEDEAIAATRASGTPGVAEITCEFCGERYHIGEERLRRLLDADAAGVDAPGRTQ